jgi:hypothetical protein
MKVVFNTGRLYQPEGQVITSILNQDHILFMDHSRGIAGRIEILDPDLRHRGRGSGQHYHPELHLPRHIVAGGCLANHHRERAAETMTQHKGQVTGRNHHPCENSQPNSDMDFEGFSIGILSENVSCKLAMRD